MEGNGKMKEIGLSNKKIKSSCQGLTGDRMAVYIPHPSSKSDYFIQALEVAIKDPEKFQEGYVKFNLCEATDVNHEPGKAILTQDLKLTPNDKAQLKNDRVLLYLPAEMKLPTQGIFISFEWVYERNPADQVTRATRSAKIAGTFDLTKSYTWTSVGNFKHSWQHEGGPNSLSATIFKGHLYNALVGIVATSK